MSTAARLPALLRRTPTSFETLHPAAVADWLIREHGFTELIPMANESYRLAGDGMVACIFAGGLVTCEGRQPLALALLLIDVCDGGDA